MAILIDRRRFVGGALALPGIALADHALAAAAHQDRPLAPLPALFDDLEQRTFRFFWERANPVNGLMPDRWGSDTSAAPAFASIAATGSALTAYPIGVERGWITRAQARDRTLTTLRFLAGLPMGDMASGTAGFRGFFYHFLDLSTGLRFGGCELSTVDTAMLHLGALFAAGWFDRNDATERAIRQIAIDLVDRAEWDWMQTANPFHHDGAITMGWHPETGFIPRAWDGYNEGKMVYILALGSGRHSARDGSWNSWTAPYDRFWRGSGDQRHLAFGPLFGHQYSEMWIDFRKILDVPMRAAGFDYFENARRATYANRAYCAANPMGWDGYSDQIWGLSACDGPGDFDRTRDGPRGKQPAEYRGYSARGAGNEPDGFDDGTIAPTAAIASLPFAPEICVPATLALHARHGAQIYGQYGFRDSFNPGFRDVAAHVDTGHVDPVHGWVAGDWIGIDQGPILAMIANTRDGGVWRVMRRSAHIRRGLRRAGFTGGWLDRAG